LATNNTPIFSTDPSSAMSSSRSRLDASITSFAGELRSFVQRASDSITALKRTVEQTPQAGGARLIGAAGCCRMLQVPT
jgi:hypothetical protein